MSASTTTAPLSPDLTRSEFLLAVKQLNAEHTSMRHRVESIEASVESLSRSSAEYRTTKTRGGPGTCKLVVDITVSILCLGLLGLVIWDVVSIEQRMLETVRTWTTKWFHSP